MWEGCFHLFFDRLMSSLLESNSPLRFPPSFHPSLPPHHQQDYYPECLQSLLIVNSNLIFRIFWNIIYPFIDDRTRHKVQMLKNEEALLDHFNPHELPPDFAHLATKE